MERETKNLEFKSEPTKTYLKTVSAYANYNDGKIIFGIKDDGSIVGIKNPIEVALQIENQINNAISPRPNYHITINDDSTITLMVEKGEYTPYLYDRKAYIRNDSSTIEVDKFEFNRLTLEGLNINFESLKASNQELTFTSLEKHFKDVLEVENLDFDLLKTLRLLTVKSGFNNAALLLSEENNFPGVDIAFLTDDIDEFNKRYTFKNMSILDMYDKTLQIYNENYLFEKILYGVREKKERIPFNAFREALANALIHRRWDINANIKIEMYQDKIIIHSPGGLESGISNEDYLNGSFSLLRNEIIADIFHRLGIVEAFATGIKRIKKAYESLYVKPKFLITDTSITIELPAIVDLKLSNNEKLILNSMNLNYTYKRSYIEEETGLSKSVVLRTLNSLESKNMISRSGVSPKILYFRIK